MIEVGQAVPPATVWTAPREARQLSELVAGRRAALFLFYLFDWSST
jgi:hypothetical protein